MKVLVNYRTGVYRGDDGAGGPTDAEGPIRTRGRQTKDKTLVNCK
jgi:hypothetical protein